MMLPAVFRAIKVKPEMRCAGCYKIIRKDMSVTGRCLKVLIPLTPRWIYALYCPKCAKKILVAMGGQMLKCKRALEELEELMKL